MNVTKILWTLLFAFCSFLHSFELSLTQTNRVSVNEDCFHFGIKVLLCDSESKVLLLKKQDRNRNVYWDLPGGRMQKGETMMETLRREVEEETGFQCFENVFPVD